MSAASVLARGRKAAERLMVDLCQIRRVTGTTLDPDTFEEVPVYTTVYTGKCRVQSRNLGTESPVAGDQQVDLYALELQVPMSVTGARVNDVVSFTKSTDPELMDPAKRFRIKNLFQGTHKTARRFPLEEITS